ncbi:MAG: methylmalonyl Co-A mutase-associated GTPase MeaB [Alphaproteobacteria bacterium]
MTDKKSDMAEITDLAGRLLAGDRRALARAITLIESRRPSDRPKAGALLRQLLPSAGKAIRLGFSGAPGVGKSSFIETFGTFLTGRGLKVAVLAIDPSSTRSGGSILGDKTRMELLSRDPNAFIRPTPSSGALGGVARRTREAMLAADAAGYDVVIIETVGVGQSETQVCDMVDMFVLLLSPGGGDELQGIKRGIMELADMVIVNKADGEFLKAAGRAAAEHQAALHLMRPKTLRWQVPVLQTSALTGDGLNQVWENIQAYREALGKSGEIAARRALQASAWMWSEVHDGLLDMLHEDPATEKLAAKLEKQVLEGKLPASEAARQILELFRRKA